MGTPVVALCGKVWVPSRAPEKFPVCPECKEAWESFKDDCGRGQHRVTLARTRLARASSVGDRHVPARLADGRHGRLRRPSPRDYLAVATPGAGKTTFALTVAAELLGRRIVDRITIVAPTEHLKLQWAEAAARAGIPHRPDVLRRQGQDVQGLRRHRGHLRRRRGQPAGDADPHRQLQDAGDPRRGAPRGRRAVVGRGRARGVPARDPAAGPDRHAVPLRHQPDPVRHLRARRRRRPAVGRRLHLRLRRTRWPTTSSGRCCSWPTPARCSGAPAPATRSPPGSASR